MNRGETAAPGRFACPCCGHWTLPGPPPGTYGTCPVCLWEDDGVQFDDPSLRGGANVVSLQEARANFRRVGASEERFLGQVRLPRPDELPS
jgi:hypothetical protein